MLQTGSILCFDRMVELGIEPGYAAKLVQNGWETVTEGLKHGGITNMMDRLTNPAKIRAYDLAEDMKAILRPLFEKHQDDIMSGHFSETMMADWANDDINLLTWRAETNATAFEEQPLTDQNIEEQTYYDQGILMVAMVKAGVDSRSRPWSLQASSTSRPATSHSTRHRSLLTPLRVRSSTR